VDATVSQLSYVIILDICQ